MNYGGCIGGVSPEGLIAEIPEVLEIAQIAVYNSTPVTSSSDATSMRFLEISLDANRRICAPNSDIVGAVMIHGTNTLAETVSFSGQAVRRRSTLTPFAGIWHRFDIQLLQTLYNHRLYAP